MMLCFCCRAGGVLGTPTEQKSMDHREHHAPPIPKGTRTQALALGVPRGIIKSISASQNCQTFVNKACANLSYLETQFMTLDAQGDNKGCMTLGIKTLKTQNALKEWEVAAKQICSWEAHGIV